MQLEPSSRAKLVSRLLDSLEADGTELSADEWDRVWSDEIDARSKSLDDGEVVYIDADAVMARLRARAASEP
jgi:putative addiction module component (TIGR02574 family)